jgi:hypothetical protein
MSTVTYSYVLLRLSNNMPQETKLHVLERQREMQVMNCARMCTEDHPKVLQVLYCKCGNPECRLKMAETIARVLPQFPVNYKIVLDDNGPKGYSMFVEMIYKKK